MKKLFIVLLSALMLASCNKNPSLPQDSVMFEDGGSVSAVEVPLGGDNFYIDEAIKLTKESAELAKSKEFVAMYTADTEVAEQISSIAQIDFDSPKAVKYIYINKDKIIEFMKQSYPEGEAGMDFEKVVELNRFSVTNFASMINARHGAKMIAATTVLARSTGFVRPSDFDGNFAVFLEYDGEFSSVVSYNEYGENVISANMTFVKNSKEHFEMLLEEIVETLGEECISVETVEKQQ